MKLAFIGGGNMAYALIAGLHQKGFAMADIAVVEPSVEKRNMLHHTFGVCAYQALADAPASDAIVLAIKPQQMREVCQQLAPLLQQQLVISIAAGIRLADLSRWLAGYAQLVRCMPNTPAQIQAGITGLYAMPQVSSTQKTMADTVLQAAGETVWVSEEAQLDAITAISGSGPAYVFYLIEALQQAGLELGLNEAAAKQLSLATFKGASLLASAVNTPVETLRAQVTSKGGTTEQGILSLINDDVKNAICRAAKQAAARAVTLGDELGAA